MLQQGDPWFLGTRYLCPRTGCGAPVRAPGSVGGSDCRVTGGEYPLLSERATGQRVLFGREGAVSRSPFVYRHRPHPSSLPSVSLPLLALPSFSSDLFNVVVDLVACVGTMDA